MIVDPAFWRGRRVLLTGHTGFKGGWAALWLARMGAQVSGLGLAPDSKPNLYGLAGVAADVTSHIVDIGNRDFVGDAVDEADPEIVLHMAAQPLVRRAVMQPVETFATNVMGTVHLLDALRDRPWLRAVLVVTTDKVYRNAERGLAFVEDDPLGGHEPYGASKAAAEIVTEAMSATYFAPHSVAMATARGGNVIGGGDFSEDRLVPDVIRALARGERLVLRNPLATRPWQHVLDCLGGYFCFLQALHAGTIKDRALNIGPADAGVNVAALAGAIMVAMGARAQWDRDPKPAPHESVLLALNASRSYESLGWRDRYPGEKAIEATAGWYTAWNAGRDMRAETLAAIDAYMIAQGTPLGREAVA